MVSFSSLTSCSKVPKMISCVEVQCLLGRCALRQNGETCFDSALSYLLFVSSLSFFHRAQFNQGVNFLSLKPSNAGTWDIRQESGMGKSAVSVRCQRKRTSSGNRYGKRKAFFPGSGVCCLVMTTPLHGVHNVCRNEPDFLKCYTSRMA